MPAQAGVAPVRADAVRARWDYPAHRRGRRAAAHPRHRSEL